MWHTRNDPPPSPFPSHSLHDEGEAPVAPAEGWGALGPGPALAELTDCGTDEADTLESDRARGRFAWEIVVAEAEDELEAVVGLEVTLRVEDFDLLDADCWDGISWD